MTKNEAAAALGALGGRARAKSMTKKEREESAREAAAARWKDHKKVDRKSKSKKGPKS